MYGKSKELRDGIVKEIEQETIALEMASKANESNSTYESLLVLFIFVCLLTQAILFPLFYTRYFLKSRRLVHNLENRSSNLRTGVLPANLKRKKK